MINNNLNNPYKSHSLQKRQNINFQGYAACPLKRLYLHPDSIVSTNSDIDVSPQVTTMGKDLQNIGRKEGFEVIFHLGNKVTQNASEAVTKITSIMKKKMSPWCQDNKFVLSKNGVEEIAENAIVRQSEANTTEMLAKNMGVKFHKMKSRIDGGNAFIGKKDNGEFYALIGSDALDDTTLKIAYEEQGLDIPYLLEASTGDIRVNLKDRNPYYGLLPSNLKELKGEKFIRNGNVCLKAKEALNNLNKNKQKYIEKAKNYISEDLNIARQDVHFVKQPDFHIDMEIRPLKYPYLLVNDPNCSKNILEKAMQSAKTQKEKQDIKALLDQTLQHEKEKGEKYNPKAEVIKELEDQGFKLIKVPGTFGDASTNFMNAIIHQRPNGDLVYITNKSSSDESKLINLNKLYQDEIQKQVPEIKQFYFVGGLPNSPLIPDKSKENINFISSLLKYESGGTHCITEEHPDFANWK